MIEDTKASTYGQIRHGEAPPSMSPRERFARMWTLTCRGLAHWKVSLAILLLGVAAAVSVAKSLNPVYRAESTVLVKNRIRMDDRDDASSSPEQIVRQEARLKDMLTTRGRLETAIKKFGLYPETVADRSMLDAVEEMKPHVGFRSLEGALYVISFDGGRPDTVQEVTEYLSDSLIGDYAAADLDDLRRDADFLAKQEQASLDSLEDATRALTVFLAAHPEFAVEANKTNLAFGASPAAGFAVVPGPRRAGMDPTLAVDGELAALYRERARLDAAAHGGAITGGTSTLAIDEPLTAAQAQVDVEAKRVLEAEADVASKSNLTQDHPDMRAARMVADAAVRRLRDAKATLATLQQLRALSTVTPEATPVPPAIAEKLRQVDAQIAARRARLGGPASAPPDALQPPSSPSAGKTNIVELETEWQRLVRPLSEAKEHHDDLKLRAQRSKLALEAARVQANEEMAVVDPPFRPTHPSKGGRTRAAMAGFAMALLLSVAYASARVALDDTLIDGYDIEAMGLIPVLCLVPRLEPQLAAAPPAVHDRVPSDASS